MSDGDIGGGLSFWATISIQGTLKKEQLNAVMTEVKKILNNKVTAGSSPVVGSSGDAINGEVRHAARIANTTAPDVSVSFRPPDSE